jgi:hypothetical protein
VGLSVVLFVLAYLRQGTQLFTNCADAIPMLCGVPNFHKISRLPHTQTPFHKYFWTSRVSDTSTIRTSISLGFSLSAGPYGCS